MENLSQYQKDIFYTILEQRRFLKSLSKFEIKYIIGVLKSELKYKKFNNLHN